MYYSYFITLATVQLGLEVNVEETKLKQICVSE